MERSHGGHERRRRRGASIALAVVLRICAPAEPARALHADLPCDAVGPANGLDPVLCTEQNLADCDCAALLAGEQACTGEAPPGFRPLTNILWVMADDQAYCMYRFMHQPGTDDAGAPLRVNDLGCRYRNSRDLGGGSHDDAFAFGRDRVSPTDLGRCRSGRCSAAYCNYDGAPSSAGLEPLRRCTTDADCTFAGVGGTFAGTCVVKPCGTDAECRILVTPTLDELARQGAVFPVMHVPANSCVPSWKGIAIGRHAKDAQATVAASGVLPCECPVGCAESADCPEPDPPLSRSHDGCSGGQSCCGGCENTRTFARLLHESTRRPASATFMLGKIRDPDDGLFGYNDCESFKRTPNDEHFGMITEGNCETACRTHIVTDYLPDGRIDTLPPRDSIEEIQEFVDWLDALPLDATRELQHPFLLGWSPINPHDGQHTSAPQVIEAIYCNDSNCSQPFGGRSPDAAQNLARVTRADYMLGVLRDQLARRCVCHGGQPASLWDMTVVIFHSDHGAFMPDSKQREPEGVEGRGENGSRSTLLISHPGHRDRPPAVSPAIKPEVFASHVVQTVDVFRTMVEHFDDVDDQASGGDVPADLKGKDLWELMSQAHGCATAADCPAGATCDPRTDGGTVPRGFCRRGCAKDADCPSTDICVFDGRQRSCRRRIRDVMVTQGGTGNSFQPWASWVVRPRPGLVGICAADAMGGTPPDLPNQRLRFCVTDRECAGLGAGIACQKAADGDRGAGICMNRGAGRRSRCQTDRDCAAGLCAFEIRACPNDGVCTAGEAGSFFDLADTSCTPTSGCVPAGVCAPPALRYAAMSIGTPKAVDTSHVFVFELHGDPDQTTNLGTGSLGSCLACLLERCAERWETWGPASGTEPVAVARCLDPTYDDGACAGPCT
jgi:hypothetical protein